MFPLLQAGRLPVPRRLPPGRRRARRDRQGPLPPTTSSATGPASPASVGVGAHAAAGSGGGAPAGSGVAAPWPINFLYFSVPHGACGKAWPAGNGPPHYQGLQRGYGCEVVALSSLLRYPSTQI